ncbi:MAG: hypothetical protein VB118_06570 [Oscillospiraceae bacterium]|nr:hypothetical protein [Oscillospiraceae bacterium]
MPQRANADAIRRKSVKIIDNESLERASLSASSGTGPRGIGRYKEKTLHSVIKYCFDPDETHHEVKFCGYVADVFDGTRVTEIQTRDLYRLKSKLSVFSASADVTVVFPVAAKKRLLWIDPGSGEISSVRRSPKRGTALDILPELYGLKAFIPDSRVCFCALLLEIDEYRVSDGWARGGHAGSHRDNRVPLGVCGCVYLCGPCDYAKLIPEGLPAEFTSKEFAKAAGMASGAAYRSVSSLVTARAAEKCGKRGHADLYRRIYENGRAANDKIKETVDIYTAL